MILFFKIFLALKIHLYKKNLGKQDILQKFLLFSKNYIKASHLQL